MLEPAGDDVAQHHLPEGHAARFQSLGRIAEPRLEPAAPVLDAASGGEREHPALAPSGDQGAADLVAVHAWQVAVQHDHVVAVDRGAVQGGLAIPRHIGGYALAAQHAGNRLGQLLMIFDEQYPHRCLPLAGV